jgi:Cu+-exporting ATPase
MYAQVNNSIMQQTGEHDPVCGMKVDPSKAAASVEHQGATVYFCSESCAAKFRAAPEKYAPAKPVTAPLQPTAKTEPQVEYTCPMHLKIKQMEPGSCPKCVMALEPREVKAEEANPELADMTRRFWISVALAVPMLTLMVSAFLPSMPMQHLFSARAWAWIEFALATPVVLWCGLPFFVRGWQSLGRLCISLNPALCLDKIISRG